MMHLTKPKEVSYSQLNVDFDGFAQRSVSLLHDMPQSYGQMSMLELSIVSRMVQCMKPKRIFEFGRCDGMTTLQLAASNPEAHIWTLDLPTPLKTYETSNSAVSHDRWKSMGVYDRITEVLVDSKDYVPSEDMLGTFDAVLIDGGHEWSEISADTENAVKMLREGGLIIWHDYQKRNFPAVTAYLSYIGGQFDAKWINSRADYLETSIVYAFE